MALSGTITKNVGSHWALKLIWSATQNQSDNTSTITAKLYWCATSSSGAISSSTTKDGSVTIEGTASTFSGAGLASLTGNQQKLIHTFTKTVTHNSDGTGSFSLAAFFDLEFTLGGTYYGRVSLSGTANLDAILKPSTLTASSQTSWTVGNSPSFTISRASGKFTHVIKIYVSGNLIKTVQDITNFTIVNFTVAENTRIFTLMAQASSIPVKVDLHTYSGTDLIGSNSYNGTLTAPKQSSTTWSGSFAISTTVRGTITSYNSSFRHVVALVFGDRSFTLVDKEFQGSWEYDTSLIASELYALTPNSNTLKGQLYIYTYYNNVQVRKPEFIDITALVNPTYNSPEFTAGFTYEDISTAVSITGNKQVLIQDVSNVRVIIPVASKAVAKNGATMVRYIATLDGNQVIASYSNTSDIEIQFPVVTSDVDTVLRITAEDSRGNSTMRTLTIPVLPYQAPNVIRSVQRVNNFESNTKVALSGTISALQVNGVSKNSLSVAKYRYKLRSATSWGSYTNFTVSKDGNKYTAQDVYLNLDNTNSWDVEIYVADKISTYTEVIRVSQGRPVLFIDSKKKSVGVNKFPEQSESFEVGGVANFDSPVTFNSSVTFEDSINTVNINTSSLNVEGTAYLYGDAQVTGDITVEGSIVNEAYISPSLQNGWTNFSTSGGYQGASYWKDKNGVVHLTGLIKGGTTTNATVLFTLPVGYRPSGQQIFLCHGSTKYVRVDVQANGNVIGNANLDATWTSLAGISFRAER